MSQYGVRIKACMSYIRLPHEIKLDLCALAKRTSQIIKNEHNVNIQIGNCVRECDLYRQGFI